MAALSRITLKKVVYLTFTTFLLALSWTLLCEERRNDHTDARKKSPQAKLPGWKALGDCQKRGLRFLYFVHTAPNNVKKRNWLRRTIGAPHIASLLRSTIVFFVGTVADQNETRKIQEEAVREGDTVILNFADSYQNLPKKFIRGAEWVLDNCLLDSDLMIVKIDDDVVVNVFALSAYASSDAGKLNGIHCLVFENVKPSRNRRYKWYVSEKTYSRDKYPDYCAGAAFMMKPDVLSTLCDASDHVSPFWVDDVYVTGMLAEYANISLVDIGPYLGFWGGSNANRMTNTTLFIHTGPPNRLHRTSDKLWDRVIRINRTVNSDFKWTVGFHTRKVTSFPS
ncbi:beta-1,3-galactosyltransferase 5-like [Haemaphysalis longicornis]